MKKIFLLLIFAIVQNQVAYANILNRNCVSSLYVRSHDIDITYHGFGNYQKMRDDSCKLLSGDGFLLIFSVKKDSKSIIINSQINGQEYGPKNEILLFDTTALYPASIPAWADQFIQMYRSSFEKLVPNHLATYDQKLAARQKAIDDENARLMQEQANKRKIEEDGKRVQLLADIEQLRPEWAKLNPGQLYAKADEFLSREESLKARAVFRTLLSRFPDHPLAATAAQQISRMTE